MEKNSELIAAAKGVALVIGERMPADSKARTDRVDKAWKEAGVAFIEPDLISSLAIADNELQKTRRVLPSEAFADIALVRMRLALQSLAETGEFAPAYIEDCASKAADFVYTSARNDLAVAAEVLTEEREALPLAIISSYNGEVAETVKKLGLDKAVHTVIDCDSESIEDALEAARKSIGINADEMLVVSRNASRIAAQASKSGLENVTLAIGSDDSYLEALRKTADMLEELES